MVAEIIAVGTEILLGDIVNTNAQYISQKLADLGMSTYRQTIVGDNEKRLLEAFESAFKTADIVIATGGLGPTEDDITKETSCKYFNKELIVHEESYKIIDNMLKKNGRTIEGSNKKQALFPEDSIVIKNNNGTAPGCILEKDGKYIVVLPGPPKEMVPMFDESVIPFLKKFSSEVIFSKTLRIIGLGESLMAEKIQDIINGQSNPTIAPYAKDSEVTLRITAKASNVEDAKKIIAPVEEAIRKRLGINVYGEDDDTLEKVIVDSLNAKKYTLSIAESCTGGMISSMIVNSSGASNVFLEGLITYSNEAKMRSLKVKGETLSKYGAVSYEVAKEMSEGVCKYTGSNVGISVTGIAGPDGGTEEKPIGLVYGAVTINNVTKVKKFNFNGDRNAIRLRASKSILDFLRRELIEE